jgi:hypothetical protein
MEITIELAHREEIFGSLEAYNFVGIVSQRFDTLWRGDLR